MDMSIFPRDGKAWPPKKQQAPIHVGPPHKESRLAQSKAQLGVTTLTSVEAPQRHPPRAPLLERGVSIEYGDRWEWTRVEHTDSLSFP